MPLTEKVFFVRQKFTPALTVAANLMEVEYVNREILFRGKRIDNGEWVEGGYWLNDTVTRQTSHIIDYDGNSHAVDPSTIGQYTSLTDKNSVKIFEGDICKDSLGWVFTVVWNNDARFLGRSQDGRIAYVGRVPKVEVIGNIYNENDKHHDEQTKGD